MIRSTVNSATVSQPKYELIVEKDVEVPLRDALSLKCDIFRPKGNEAFPAIVTLGPYPKDEHIDYGDKAEENGPYMHWESANPEWWVPRGYAQVRVDMRGSGQSPGFCDIVSPQESEDYYDTIEWVASHSWCNARVGLMGISYFAVNQWNVAALRPPSLKAMIPWEGWSDLYRDCTHHGGIFADGFFTFWYWNRVVKRSLGEETDRWRDQFAPFLDDIREHELDGPYYRERSARFEEIAVPFLSAGNWGGTGLHLRGNTEAFMRAASKHKWLRMHTGTHIGPFYRLEARLDQLRFFDYWLKEIENGLLEDPPVKLAIRTTADDEEWRFENEWPLARTRWTKLYLSLEDGGRLTPNAPKSEGDVSYSADGPRTDEFRGARFSTEPFDVDTEITGPMNLVLSVSSTNEDMDIFVVVRNIAPNGSEVSFPNGQGQPSPVSRGWLRASHRKLDPDLSLPFRPYHQHDEILSLRPGETAVVEIEILPMCNVFKKGHRLQLDLQPWDDVPTTRYSHDNSACWSGRHTIHVGGEHPSYLLTPFVPSRGTNLLDRFAPE
jgi:predicted acyl esterase